MSFTNEQYKEKISSLYLEMGPTTAIAWAVKQKRTKFEYCDGCETEVPVIREDHICLLCGQATRVLKEDED